MANIHRDVVHLLKEFTGVDYEIEDDLDSDTHVHVAIPEPEAEVFAGWLLQTI